MNIEAWWVAVHRIAKSQTGMSNRSTLIFSSRVLKFDSSMIQKLTELNMYTRNKKKILSERVESIRIILPSPLPQVEYSRLDDEPKQVL